MTTATSKSNSSTATSNSANSNAAQVEAPFTEKATEVYKQHGVPPVDGAGHGDVRLDKEVGKPSGHKLARRCLQRLHVGGASVRQPRHERRRWDEYSEHEQAV